MKVGDLVYLMRAGQPVVGEIIAFTPKRARVAVRVSFGYIAVLRAVTNLQLAKRARRLI